MRRNDVIAWVLSVTASLRLSQSKTLSVLVAAALATPRISLAELGRHLTGPAAAKHRIKRTWRFTANERIEVATAMRGVVRRLLRRGRKRPGRGKSSGRFKRPERGGYPSRIARHHSAPGPPGP